MLTGHDSAHDYPAPARLIRYWDKQHNLRLRFLTNHFQLPALTIAQLYKRRWGVELFFKWIKQHLRIKKFYGTSPNAVRTQIWVAMIVYLLVAILKKQYGIEAGLYRILQILSVTVFDKTPILQVLQGLDSQSSPVQPLAFSNPRMSLKWVRTEKGKRQGEDLLSEGLGGKGFERSHESGAPGDTIDVRGRLRQPSRAVLLRAGLVNCPIRFQGLAEPDRGEPGGRPRVRLSEASGRRRAVSSCVAAFLARTRYR